MLISGFSAHGEDGRQEYLLFMFVVFWVEKSLFSCRLFYTDEYGRFFLSEVQYMMLALVL